MGCNISLEEMLEEAFDNKPVVSFRKPTVEDMDEISNMMDEMDKFILSEYLKSPYAEGINKDSYSGKTTISDIEAIFKDLIIILKGEEVVGYVQFAKNSNENVHISSIYIKEEARGDGIGKRVLEFVELYAKKSGMKTVTIRCITTNVPAITLYKNFGFEEYHVSLVKILKDDE